MRAPALVLLALLTLAAQEPSPPKEARRAFDKAAAALKAKHPDEAIRNYEQAVAIFPAYAAAWFELGRLRRANQQPGAARTAFESAIHADPKYADAYMALALVETDAKRWPQLIAVTDALLKIDPLDYPQGWLLNAVGNYNIHNFPAAEKSAREAQRLDPNHKIPETPRMLGLILAMRGDFAGAAGQFRQFLAAVPTGPDADAVRGKLADVSKAAGNASTDLSGAAFRTETSLAVVSFQLRQTKGQPARQLTPEDIEVREDGIAQKIAIFEGGATAARTVPVEISLLFDCSSSVERIMAFNSRLFRDNILDEFPNASIAIYAFSDDLARLARPTRDPATLKKAMDLVGAIPKNSTPLFGSIADEIRDASTTGANVIRMAVIFSDGESESLGDENRAAEVVHAAAESGTAIFPVTLSSSGALSPQAAESINDFVNLAAATGGKEFHGMMGADILPAVLKSIAAEIRSDYVVGFYVPAAPGEPQKRRVEVVLRAKDQGRIYGGSRVLVH